MADQSGSQIVTGFSVPATGAAGPGGLAQAEPGTLADPGHQHSSFHGRPVSWAAVVVIIAGFLCGGLSLVFTAWTTFWVGAGLVAVGALLAMATDMFEDWY
jgi:phosphatidylserine synthase